MNYSKPEVKTLGEATVVIETTKPGFKTSQVVLDGSRILAPTPAYDLDE